MNRGQMRSLTTYNPLVTPTMKAILYDVLHCPFNGLMKRLFLKAKLLELLALQTDQVSAGQAARTTALRPADVASGVSLLSGLINQPDAQQTNAHAGELHGVDGFAV